VPSGRGPSGARPPARSRRSGRPRRPTLYTLGFVTEEQGVQPLAGERREGYDVDDRARRMADFPLSAAAGAEIFEDCDRHFEEGLALVNAGIGTRYGVG
jgi:hypothetical protein